MKKSITDYEPAPKCLLVLSCSDRKVRLQNKPALNVYDGPSYRILRRYLNKTLDVLILSAKYGLIEGSKRISFYNLRMRTRTAVEIRESTTRKLLEQIHKNNYTEIFVDLGALYLEAIDLNQLVESSINIIMNSGTIGIRLHNLKIWLEDVCNLAKQKKN